MMETKGRAAQPRSGRRAADLERLLGYLSLREVAELAHLDHTVVWRAIKRGNLMAVKRWGQWFVARAEAERYAQGPRPITQEGKANAR